MNQVDQPLNLVLNPPYYSIATDDVLRYKHLISQNLWERLVARVLKDTPGITKEIAASIVDGALGFLFLCAQYPEQMFAPSKLVDVGWHTFILYTKDYQDFCLRIAGYFIHHEPNDGGTASDNMTSQTTVRFMEERGLWYNPKLWERNADDCNVDCKDDCKKCSGNSCTKIS